MNFEDQIREVLFQIGRELKVHRLDNDNMILEIDYEKYVEQIKQILKSSTYGQQ